MSQLVLLIEDDPELGRQIVGRLRKSGYATQWWTEGRPIASETVPAVDLVVLDLMLPGVSGLDLLKQLREHSEVPVLVLSARNDTRDKVRALQLGADDYMTKPFWPEELVERVRARLRRPVLRRDDVVRLGSVEIQPAARRVFRDGEPVALTPIELELLLALTRRRGMAVTRQWLVANVLGDPDGGSDRSLDAHVSRLRRKLGAREAIETVWGIGYRIAGEEGE